MHKKFWSDNLKGRNYREGQYVAGRIILKLILKKWDGRVGTGLI
jgi:hypothetical protein